MASLLAWSTDSLRLHTPRVLIFTTSSRALGLLLTLKVGIGFNMKSAWKHNAEDELTITFLSQCNNEVVPGQMKIGAATASCLSRIGLRGFSTVCKKVQASKPPCQEQAEQTMRCPACDGGALAPAV